MANPVSLTPAINIYRGDSFTKTFTMTAKDENGVLQPVNILLFGTEWSAQLRPSADSTTVIPFTVDTSNGTAGKITLTLGSDVSHDVPSKGVWDVQVVDNTQNPPFVRTLLRGTFNLIKDVTRP